MVSSLVAVVNLKHEMAWQQHFCTNMFIRPVDPEELDDFEPDFTVMNACAEKVEDWERLGLNSETAVVFSIEKGKALIFGTYYGGENKKGIFSLMNYLLPLSSPPQLPMHCSANVGKNDDVCLFFGLSGTGKTTLSADPNRALVGDDEHGWSDNGVFNFEGGCYAKLIRLSKEDEPAIYATTKMPGSILENVVLNADGSPDFDNGSLTQNTRGSYPIEFIENRTPDSMAGNHADKLSTAAMKQVLRYSTLPG